MAFSTIAQVRACNDKLELTADVADANITDRIAEADDTIYVDLSGMFTEAQLTTLGSSNKTLNLLSKWKATELVLSRAFGAARQADAVSDVDYWRKKYDDLIQRVLNGEITLTTSSGVEPTNKPVITSSTYRKKLFPAKGIADFEEGTVDDQY
jgi:hypothetical protein